MVSEAPAVMTQAADRLFAPMCDGRGYYVYKR
jgi:hypothetical protein